MSEEARLFFHEDDYGQVEILPASNAAWCRDELAKVGAFADRHRAADGLGWTDGYVLAEAAERLGALGIAPAMVDTQIPPALPRHDRIFTGTTARPEPCDKTRGYRIDDEGALYVAWTDESVVRAIWLVGAPDEARRAPLVEALSGIGELAELLLVDWRGALVDLANEAAIAKYVGSL